MRHIIIGAGPAGIAAGRELAPIPDHILNKHYTRKHGTDAYYGQS